MDESLDLVLLSARGDRRQALATTGLRTAEEPGRVEGLTPSWLNAGDGQIVFI